MLNNIASPERVIASGFRRVRSFLLNHLIQDVPEVDALCEFDCRKLQCTSEEWASCERRLHKAAGELMPINGHTSQRS
jgi:hypothetical protein